jgi:hypothetical protein
LADTATADVPWIARASPQPSSRSPTQPAGPAGCVIRPVARSRAKAAIEPELPETFNATPELAA